MRRSLTRSKLSGAQNKRRALERAKQLDAYPKLTSFFTGGGGAAASGETSAGDDHSNNGEPEPPEPGEEMELGQAQLPAAAPRADLAEEAGDCERERELNVILEEESVTVRLG